MFAVLSRAAKSLGSAALWLGLIFIVALVLRLHDISASPPSLYWEEVALGYDAYSILQTGKDHHGNPFPIVAFPSFGDFKPSLYFYALVPSVKIFGLTPLAVRAPAALASAGTVVLASWLAWRWTGSKQMMAWSGVLLAIQPWSWLIGRVGFETNLAVFLIVGAVVIFEIAENSKNAWVWRVLGAAILALSAYAYHSARLWAPLVGLVLWLTQTEFSLPREGVKSWFTQYVRGWLAAGAVAAILLVPILAQANQPAVQQRIAETSIFSSQLPVQKANEIQSAWDRSLLSRVIFHRWVFWGETVTRNYVSHFSPSFLFGTGDQNGRHSTQLFGMLAPWEAATVLVGSGVLCINWHGRKRSRNRLIGLLLLAPIPAMFTFATPHALRTLLLSPWLAVVSGIGITVFITWIARSTSSGFLRSGIMLGACTAVLLSATLYWTHLRFIYPHQTAHQWQYGYQEVITSLRDHQRNNEPIFMTLENGRPAMYVFFFDAIAPTRVQAADPTAQKDQQDFRTFEEWTFFSSLPDSPGLYALTGTQELPLNVTVLDEIQDGNGRVFWRVVRRE